jgi:hypothetical protein
MKKTAPILVLFVLIVLSNLVYSQKLKDRLEGEWVCLGITDSNGRPTHGKFGEPDEYLRFRFNKKTLEISEAPYDMIVSMNLAFNENSFDWAPNATIDLPERIYYVKELDSTRMTLTTRNESTEITYHFVNQKNYPVQKERMIDNGAMIIKHIQFTKKNPNNINRTFETRISNDPFFLSPAPKFDYPTGGSFGQILSHKIMLPKDFKPDVVSDEMIVDFEVSDKGAGNFKITKGLGDELDAEVLTAMKKLGKSWKPIVVDGKPITSTCRFHLFFYKTVDELILFSK